MTYIACEKCKYNDDGTCDFYYMGSGNEIDMPCYREKELIKEEWIPVSERLPKAGEYVGDVAKYYLVQNEYGDMLVARYTHSEYWEQIYQLKPYSDRIVAWRELPEPYETDEEWMPQYEGKWVAESEDKK